MNLFADEVSTAVISPCNLYRYVLTRTWDAALPAVAWIMLNPSVADAAQDDPTIRRVVRFSRDMGAGGCVVVNLFALRATDPAKLRTAADPVGPDNDRHINFEATPPFVHRRVIAAWGAHPMAVQRARDVLRTLKEAGVAVECLGKTKDGQPRHPLYLKADARPVLLEGNP